MLRLDRFAPWRESCSKLLKLVLVTLALQNLQPLRMPGLIGVYFSRPVQVFRRSGEISRTAIHIEELQQSQTVVALPVRCVEQLAEELQHFGRGLPRRGYFLHHCQKLPPLSTL